MSQIKELLIDQLRDLLHAETQLVNALPKMADAANHPRVKEAFGKHLAQTQVHVERVQQAFELLGEEASPKPCKAMMGLIEEGNETIEEGREKEAIAADLSLIAAAQRVEHYEISAYGTARGLARQMGQFNCARLLSQTLGEEEATDFLLTALSDPLVQRLSLDDAGADVDLGNNEERLPLRTGKGQQAPKAEKKEKNHRSGSKAA
jgi:Mn-containing catalase